MTFLLRRWLTLVRRWAWIPCAASATLTLAAAVESYGRADASNTLVLFGVYCAAAYALLAFSVVVGSVLPSLFEGAAGAPAGLKLAALHAVGMAVCAMPLQWLIGLAVLALLPDRYAFHKEIAHILAAHAAIVVAAALSYALFRLRRGPHGYPFWIWAPLYVATLVSTHSALTLVLQERTGVVEAAALGVVFVCLALGRKHELRSRALQLGFSSVGLAAAIGSGITLQTHAALRVDVAQAYPGAAALLRFARGLYDLDGDGFSSILGGGDCDDNDPHVHPAALEIAGNGRDDNCFGGELSSYTAPRPPTFRRAAPRHSLVLITIDALRADTWSASPNATSATPSLSKFGRDSAVFPRTYVQAPFTTDSLQALITGSYPMSMTIGTRWLGAGPDLPSLLRGAGYETQAVHSLDFRDPNTKQRAETSTFLLNFEHVDRTLAAVNRNPRGVTSKGLTDRAIGHFDRLAKSQRPFMLWVHYFDPHAEYVAHPGTPFSGDSLRNRYLQEVFATDAEIGRLLVHIDASGFLAHGLVAVTGDHGELLGEDGRYQHAVYLDEECLKTVLLLRGPGVRPGIYPTRIRSIDLFPTLLEQAAGIDVQSDGTGLRPIWTGGERADRDVIVRTTYAGSVYQRAIIQGPWKLTQDLANGTVNLYRLDSDPQEHSDLAGSQPEMQQVLMLAMGRVFDHAINDRVLALRQGSPQ